MKHSYIVVSKSTGKAVFEFFNEANKKHINTNNYTILTAFEYLMNLNKTIRGAQ